jgi:tellurite resistance protein TerB
MPSREMHIRSQSEIIDAGKCDEQIVAALVTAGALVAVADRHVDPIERDEVVNYITERRLVPGFAGPCIAALFDERARLLQEPDFLNVVIDALRPVPRLSLSSDVIEIAERVAAADRHFDLCEQRAIKLIRLIAM